VSIEEFLAAVADPLQRIGWKLNMSWPAAALLVAAFAVVALLVVRRARGTGLEGPSLPRDGLLGWFAAGVAARWLYLRLFLEESAVVPWYWVPEFVLACVLVGVVVGWAEALALRHWPALRRPLVGALASVAALGVGLAYIHGDASRDRESTAPILRHVRAAASLLPPDAICAANDAGRFGYFSGLRTVALSGLIGDERTMLDSFHDRKNAILRRSGVQCLMWYLTDQELAAVPREAILQRTELPRHDQGRWLVTLDPRVWTPYRD
jgi:hypothetical protein